MSVTLKHIFTSIKNTEKRLIFDRQNITIKELQDLLSDDFIEFGPSGRIYNKAQTIKVISPDNLFKFSISKFYISTLGNNHFLITYKLLKSYNGKRIYSLRSSVWKLEKDKLQIIFHQGTTIKEEF